MNGEHVDVNDYIYEFPYCMTNLVDIAESADQRLTSQEKLKCQHWRKRFGIQRSRKLWRYRSALPCLGQRPNRCFTCFVLFLEAAESLGLDFLPHRHKQLLNIARYSSDFSLLRFQLCDFYVFVWAGWLTQQIKKLTSCSSFRKATAGSRSVTWLEQRTLATKVERSERAQGELPDVIQDSVKVIDK